MAECKIERNMGFCNCSYEPCSKKGMCCECIQYHKRLGELPACLFPDDIEKGFDRSVANFVKVWQKRRHM